MNSSSTGACDLGFRSSTPIQNPPEACYVTYAIEDGRSFMSDIWSCLSKAAQDDLVAETIAKVLLAGHKPSNVKLHGPMTWREAREIERFW